MFAKILQSTVLAAGILGASAHVAGATVPVLDVGPTCRNIDGSVGPTRRTSADCFKAEDDARAELVKVWESFSAPDRGLCTQTARMGGIPSYVQLLTCLELRRDARKLPPDQLVRTEDAASKR